MVTIFVGANECEPTEDAAAGWKASKALDGALLKSSKPTDRCTDCCTGFWLGLANGFTSEFDCGCVGRANGFVSKEVGLNGSAFVAGMGRFFARKALSLSVNRSSSVL